MSKKLVTEQAFREAARAGRVEADTELRKAFTVEVNFEPRAVATDVLTIGATFWKPVTCFGSARTVYFEFLPSGGSVEKTAAASALPESSAAYGLIPASGMKSAFVTP